MQVTYTQPSPFSQLAGELLPGMDVLNQPCRPASYFDRLLRSGDQLSDAQWSCQALKSIPSPSILSALHSKPGLSQRTETFDQLPPELPSRMRTRASLLERLPDELLTEIAKYSMPESFDNLRSVSIRWYNVCRHLFERHKKLKNQWSNTNLPQERRGSIVRDTTALLHIIATEPIIARYIQDLGLDTEFPIHALLDGKVVSTTSDSMMSRAYEHSAKELFAVRYESDFERWVRRACQAHLLSRLLSKLPNLEGLRLSPALCVDIFAWNGENGLGSWQWSIEQTKQLAYSSQKIYLRSLTITLAHSERHNLLSPTAYCLPANISLIHLRNLTLELPPPTPSPETFVQLLSHSPDVRSIKLIFTDTWSLLGGHVRALIAALEKPFGCTLGTLHMKVKRPGDWYKCMNALEPLAVDTTPLKLRGFTALKEVQIDLEILTLPGMERCRLGVVDGMFQGSPRDVVPQLGSILPKGIESVGLGAPILGMPPWAEQRWMDSVGAAMSGFEEERTERLTNLERCEVDERLRNTLWILAGKSMQGYLLVDQLVKSGWMSGSVKAAEWAVHWKRMSALLQKRTKRRAESQRRQFVRQKRSGGRTSVASDMLQKLKTASRELRAAMTKSRFSNR